MKCLEENKKTGYRKAVNMKVGIIGMGNMGAKYALMIAKGDVKGMELAAITRVTDERWDMIRQFVSPELMKFNSGDDMYAAIDDNSLSVDAVIIVTPHYSHEELVKKAFERGISDFVINLQEFIQDRQEVCGRHIRVQKKAVRNFNTDSFSIREHFLFIKK